MEIAGIAAFDRDRIAVALVADPVTMRALQRRLDDEAAAVVAERVRELHRRGGYAKAEARGEVVDGALRIALNAGTRYLAGAVRCSGNTLVSTERIRDLLAASERDEPVWVEGQFPVADATVERRVVRVVENAYRELGRHGVRAKVDLEPSDDRLVLDLAIAGEGHEVRIQSLRLVGEEPSQHDAVLAAVRFTPGMLATSTALTALQRQFEVTGRYLSVVPERPAELPAVFDPLQITVKLRPDAAPVGNVALRDAEQLLRAADTLLENLRKGAVMCIAAELPEPAPWGGFRVLPGRVAVHFGRDGILLAADRLQWAQAAPARAAIHLAGDQLTFQYGERVSSWRFAGRVGLALQVFANFTATGECGLRWGMGLSTKGENDVVASIHPGVAAYTLAEATEVRRDGDELAIRFGDTTVRIAADGEIVGQQVTIPTAGAKVTLSRASIADARPHAAAGAAETDVGALLLELVVAVGAEAFASGRDDTRVPALLRGCLEAAASAPRAASKPKADERVPALVGGSSPSVEAMIGTIASMPAVDRRFEGRIVALSGAFGSLLQGNAEAANAGFRALAAHEPPCPLSLALAAWVHGMLGNERPAARCRELANQHWSFDRVYDDAADLVGNLDVLRPWPGRIGARWRAMTELQELFGGVPAGEAGDLAAWRKGLEVLWAAGGETKLREWLLDK